MGDWTGFLVVVGAIVAGCLAVGAWLDHEARRRGSKLASSAEMSRAIRDARREARSSRSRSPLGRRAPQRGTADRPYWDDRRR